jgi:hypothetical protein
MKDYETLNAPALDEETSGDAREVSPSTLLWAGIDKNG